MELRINETEPDANLVMQIRENNEDAKDYIYKKYSPLIHKEVNKFWKRARILGVDYQDLTQEAMLGFSDAINNFKDNTEAKFITFATVCIERHLMNYVDKFDTDKNKIFSATVALDARIYDNGEDTTLLVDNLQSTMILDPLKKIINSETLNELGSKLNNLSDNEKIAFVYDLDGKSIEEIARIMGMTNKQIYNLIFRARHKLKLK